VLHIFRLNGFYFKSKLLALSKTPYKIVGMNQESELLKGPLNQL